jgi:hypothetical protein
MEINHIFETVEVKSHPYFKETMYCFALTEPWRQDVHDIKVPINWENPASVYWTEKQLAEFMPNTGIFEYTKKVYEEVITEQIKTYKRIIRSPYYQEHSKINARFLIERLKAQTVVFVKINLVV